MGATAAADAAATVVVAKAKAKAWKLRFWGLACVLLTLSAHYFVLLPLLAAHPTFFIVLSVVPYVRMHPRKQRSTTHPAAHADSPPPPPRKARAISQRHLTPAATACAQAFLYSWPIGHKLTIDQKRVAGLSSVFSIYWLWMYDDELHLWCTGLTCAGVLSVNHFWNRA